MYRDFRTVSCEFEDHEDSTDTSRCSFWTKGDRVIGICSIDSSLTIQLVEKLIIMRSKLMLKKRSWIRSSNQTEKNKIKGSFVVKLF